jgi:hypothetical protein
LNPMNGSSLIKKIICFVVFLTWAQVIKDKDKFQVIKYKRQISGNEMDFLNFFHSGNEMD